MSRSEGASRPEGTDEVREAVLLCAPRYEVRECWRCLDGRIYEAVDPMEGPRLAPCPSCGGTGRASVYLYPKKGRQS